jgi:integrase
LRGNHGIYEQEGPQRARYLLEIHRPRGQTRGLGRDDADPRGGRFHQGSRHRPGQARYTRQSQARWSDLLWNEGRIRISKRWAKGKDGDTKTEASDGYVPLHPVLAAHLRSWRAQSAYPNGGDFVFLSMKARGRVPLTASIFVANHLRPAAKKAGVHIDDGQRFGLHNLRHSLSNWLVNKAKVEPKTVQGILRHAKIQTTLDLYTQDDGDETRAAQGEYLAALGVATQLVQ